MVSILTISGMVAVYSKRAVFTALSGVPGVLSAEVDGTRGGRTRCVDDSPHLSPQPSLSSDVR